MQQVFLWSLLPGLMVLTLLIWGLDDTPRNDNQIAAASGLRWSMLDGRIRGLIMAAAGLALAVRRRLFWFSGQRLRPGHRLVPLIWAAASAVSAQHPRRPAYSPTGLAGCRYYWPAGACGSFSLLLAGTVNGSNETVTWLVFSPTPARWLLPKAPNAH